MGEMRRMMRVELEHIYEHLDKVENTRAGQPQPIRQAHKRKRLRLDERSMTIIGMSMKKGRTQWVAIG